MDSIVAGGHSAGEFQQRARRRVAIAENQQADAVHYLDKAKGLGATDADYTLRLTYLALGDKSKALENIDAYAKRVRDDANAAKIIDVIRNGNVETKAGKP